jgi:hypothetical protein
MGLTVPPLDARRNPRSAWSDQAAAALQHCFLSLEALPRQVSSLYHSEMVASLVSPARFGCAVQSTTRGVSLRGAMYVIINFPRSCPYQVQPDRRFF